ncbi:MAG: CCA tRNA nucleotidyltransferase, partial [Thermoanaerobaculia bacterium]
RTPLYAAGGAVRDLHLGRPVEDLDLVVEGDGLRFARELARRLGSAPRAHPRFGTAVVTLPGGGRLDVAAARAETYAHPGALPRVHAASIEDDLARRDFSINAMALRLWPGPARLQDPHGGLADLERGAVRMLHPASARDDPTRAFRAVRYAARLGFRIEPRTARWIREAIDSGALRRVSGERVRREIEKILSEPGRLAAIALASRLGLGRAVSPSLAGDRRARLRLARAQRLSRTKFPDATWLSWLLVWAADLTAREAADLSRRLNLPRGHARLLRRWPELRRALERGGPLRAALTADERFAVAALGGRLGRASLAAGDVKVRGSDLLAAGVSPGPAIGRALEATRSARLSGRIGQEEELAFALAAARGGPA